MRLAHSKNNVLYISVQSLCVVPMDESFMEQSLIWWSEEVKTQEEMHTQNDTTQKKLTPQQNIKWATSD